jgi:hypothetical protein
MSDTAADQAQLTTVIDTATTGAAVAAGVTGNPAIMPLATVAAALAQGIFQLTQGTATKPLTTAEIDAEWTANSKALGIALKAYLAAK